MKLKNTSPIVIGEIVWSFKTCGMSESFWIRSRGESWPSQPWSWQAQNNLDILTMQLDNEEKMIHAAFNKPLASMNPWHPHCTLSVATIVYLAFARIHSFIMSARTISCHCSHFYMDVRHSAKLSAWNVDLDIAVADHHWNSWGLILIAVGNS